MLHASRFVLLRPNELRTQSRHCLARRSVQVVAIRGANGEYSSAAADVAAAAQSEQAAASGTAAAAAAAGPALPKLDSFEQQGQQGQQQQQQLQAPPEPADNILYISRLRKESTNNDLAALFNGQAGLQMTFLYQKAVGNQVGYAIFDSSESSAAAAKALNNKQFQGKTLTVKVHKRGSDQKKTSGSGPADNSQRQQRQSAMEPETSSSGSGSSSVESAAAPGQQQNGNGTKRGRQLRKQENVLLVSNLAWSTMTEDLKEHFRDCDGVTDAFITYNKDGRPSGSGFVTFSSAKAACEAAKVMHESDLDGRPIIIRRARAGVLESPDLDSQVAAEKLLAQALAGAAPNEQRVVIRNGPEEFSVREYFGMCSVFGAVESVILRMPGQQRMKARRSSNDGSSSSQQVQYAIVRMADRPSAERVVEGLNNRRVQGRDVALNARLYKQRRQQQQQQQQQPADTSPQVVQPAAVSEPPDEISQGSE